MSAPGAGQSTFPNRCRVDANSALGAAGVNGECESQHVDRLFGTPPQRALPGAQPAQPVSSGIPEAAGPVVVERMVGPHLSVDIRLEARLLNAAAGAPVHSRSTAMTP